MLLKHAKGHGWQTIEDLEGVDEGRFTQGLKNPIIAPSRAITFKMPDYEYVHSELAKPHAKAYKTTIQGSKSMR